MGRSLPARRPAVSAHRFLAFLLLSLASFALPSHAQMPAPSVYDVQSVYLYNFAKFVRWPPSDQHDTLTLCVAGDKLYTDSLTRIVAGERIASRPLAVRPVLHNDDIATCDILFIAASAKDRTDSLLAAAAGKPILTVSDIPGFFARGGMMQFLVIDNRVRFSVDLRPVNRSGLSLSSELLKVAVAVNGTPAGGAQ